MDLRRLIVFKNWAEDEFFKYLRQLTKEQLHSKIPNFANSALDIVKHIVEVQWSWYHFITDKDYSEEKELNTEDLETLIGVHTRTKELIDDLIAKVPLSNPVVIHWNPKDNPAHTTNEDILFNLVNHSSYHRGQLAIMLRRWGIEVKETDFNPYNYMLAQNSY